MAVEAQFIEQFNADLRAWAISTRHQLVAKLTSYPLKSQIAVLERLRQAEGRVPLKKSVAYRLLKNVDEVNAVRFTFQRHGIFFERGHAGKNRVDPRPWLSAVLPSEIDELAGIVARGYADKLAGEISTLIPGVIDKTVRLGQ